MILALSAVNVAAQYHFLPFLQPSRRDNFSPRSPACSSADGWATQQPPQHQPALPAMPDSVSVLPSLCTILLDTEKR